MGWMAGWMNGWTGCLAGREERREGVVAAVLGQSAPELGHAMPCHGTRGMVDALTLTRWRRWTLLRAPTRSLSRTRCPREDWVEIHHCHDCNLVDRDCSQHHDQGLEHGLPSFLYPASAIRWGRAHHF